MNRIPDDVRAGIQVLRDIGANEIADSIEAAWRRNSTEALDRASAIDALEMRQQEHAERVHRGDFGGLPDANPNTKEDT